MALIYSDDFLEKLFKAQFEFYNNKGLNLYFGQKKSTSYYSYYNDYMYVCEGDIKTVDKSINSAVLIKDLSTYSRHMFELYKKKSRGPIPVYPNSDKSEHHDFVLYFLEHYPSEQKNFLKGFHYYYGNSRYNLPVWEKFETIANTLVENKVFNKKSLAQFIANFSIAIFEAKNVAPEKFCEFLENKDYSTEEVDKLIYQFYKARKNQIKEPKFAATLKDFLLKRYDYNEEKVKQYFSFFPNLESHFKVSNVNIFNESPKYSLTSILSLKKMPQAFCLDGWSLYDYQNSLSQVVAGISDYYKFPTYSVYSLQKNSDAMRVIISHNDANYLKEHFERDVNEFYHGLYDSPSVKVSKEFVKTWLAKRHLQNTLQDNEEVVVKKTKI